MVRRAREDPNVFAEFVMRGEGGEYLRQEDIHREWHEIWTHEEKSVILGPVGTGKALPVETEIATPGGWVPIGDLQVGDLVIGGDGKPTHVTFVSPVWDDHEVYEFAFDDGTTLRSDAEHQWTAWTVNDRDGGRPPRVATTREIVSQFYTPNGARPYWSIPLTAPVERPEAELPVHPYVLGVWLGDGHSDCARITCHGKDAEIVDRCIAIEGGRCGERTYCASGVVFTQVVGGVTSKRENFNPRNLRGRLRQIGVLSNKHVPQLYLTASVEQRRELLAGLMDTDGYVCPRQGTMEFCSTNDRLAHAVLELARSLGYKPTLREGRATLRGRDCGPKYRVCWNTPTPVFRLARKAQVQAAWAARRAEQGKRIKGTQRNTWDSRKIVAWRKVPSVAVRCIGVEADHHTYVATRDYIVTHNSTQLRLRLIWEIGRDPEDIRIAYVSATQGHPKKQLGSIKEEILGNPRIWEVFPKLRPSAGNREVWSQTAILVDRDSSHPDVTLECYGLYGAILGSRKNIIVFDDLCSFANTLTQASREKMENWLAEVLSRLKGKVKVWAIGHIWHEEDALQVMRKKEGWYYARYQATYPDPSGACDTRGRPLQVPCFPRVLTPVKIADLAEQLGPVYSRMMLYNEMPPALTSRFRERWFTICLKRGRNVKFADMWPAGVGRVVCGIDLGHTKAAGSDFTAMITAVVLDDGSRRLLDVRGGGMKIDGEPQGRWKADEIAANIEDLHERFDPEFYSESNGGQNLFNDLMLPYMAIPVTGSWTGTDKYDYSSGIEAIGTELRSGLWILPSDDNLVPIPGVAEMLKGAKGYDPKKHPADLLMAWWILRKGIVQGERLRARWNAANLQQVGDLPVA